MGRTRIAKAVARNLAEKRENSKKRKNELERYLSKLKENYETGKISYSRYVEIFHKKNEGRNISEWIQYYDNYNKKCEKEEKKYKRKIIKNKILTTFFALTLISFLIYFFSFTNYVNLSFTGLTVGENQKEFTQNLNLDLTNSTEYQWQLENLGKLNSVKLNGLIEELSEDSEVKIYLENLLILDSSNLKETSKKNSKTSEGISKITGGAIEENILETSPEENSIQEVSEETTETPIKEDTTIESNLEDSNQENSYSETEAPLNEDSSPSQEEPLTEENTSKEEQIKSDENETFQKETNESKIISEEIIKNETFQKETNESETFGPVPQIENESETSTKIEGEIEILIKKFKEQCEETCDLENLNLSKESYTLRIEISNARLKLDSITYEIFAEEPPFLKTNETVFSEENMTILTQQYQAILGQPVKWKKEISLKEQGIASVELPKEAENIVINKISKNSYSEKEQEVLLNESSKEAPLNEDSSPSPEEPLAENQEVKEKAKFSITGNVISSNSTERKSFKNFFKKIFSSITGFVTNIDKQEEKIQVLIEDNSTEYEIEYETPAPQAVEENSEKGKKILVSSPEFLHYENVLIFTNLNEEFKIKNPSSIKIYWIENNTYISPTKVEDKDKNGIYDYIEFIAPHLSNQTFEIIVITDALHLDSSRNFISNIYEEVEKQDNVWSETIANGEYVRVTFEKPIDNTNDISIYLRVAGGNPKIEVYEVNGTDKIAEFFPLISNEYNKVYLTGLIGEQDVFDLRVTSGSVEFDHIIDPADMWTDELVVNGGFEWGNFTGWTTLGDLSTWTVGANPTSGSAGPQAGSYCAFNENSRNLGSFFIVQNVNVTEYASYIDAGTAIINVSGWGVSSEADYDYTKINISFLFENLTIISTPIDTTPNLTGSWWKVGIYEYTVPENTRYIGIGGNTYEDFYDSGSLDSFSVKLGYNVSASFLNITDPTTANPASVSSYDNISVYFNYTADGEDITSGVSMDSVFIGGVNASIKEGAEVCSGTLDCTSLEEATCSTCSQCNWSETMSPPNGVGVLWSTQIDGTPTAVNSLYGGRAITTCPNQNQTTLYATWKASGSDLWFGRSTDNGATWTTGELTSTASTYLNIVCDTNDLLTITSVIGGDVDFWNSTNNGTNWVQYADRINHATSSLVRTSSAVCYNDNIIHTIASTGNEGIYSNSTNEGGTFVTLATTSSSDDWDAGDLTLDKDCNVYIVGSGTDLDDLEVWSSKSWGTSYVINAGPGAFAATDIPKIHATKDGKLYLSGVWGVDLWFCNSTTDNWNVSWSCQEPDTENSYRSVMYVTEDGESIYLLYVNSSTATASGIFMTNSSDGGKTWSVRQFLGMGANLAQFNYVHPIANVTERMHLLYEEGDFDVIYGYINTSYETLQNTCSNNIGGSCSTCSVGDCETNCGTAGCSLSSTKEFSYIPTLGWQVNVTVPAFESGLKNLFVNATYGGNTINDTQTNAINYGGVTDTTPPYFTSIPSNASLFYGNESLAVDFDAEDSESEFQYYVNDTKFSTNSSGFLLNATSLGVESYSINLTINDSYNNKNWTIYSVEVNPSQEKCQVLFNETSPLQAPQTFLVWANCTSSFVLSRNGTTIENNSEQSLEAGYYNFSVLRNDTTNYSYIYNETDFTITPQILDCGILDTAYGNYTLTQNVTSTGMCFNITAQNITLDCNGFWINYSTDGGNDEMGIYSNQFNTTIKNCNIIDGNWAYVSDSREGIYLYANNSTLFNNSVTTNTTTAIYLPDISEFNNLTKNTAMSGASGIIIGGSNNTLIENTGNSTTAAAWYHSGIIIMGNENTLINNTAGGQGYALYISGDNCIFTNNTAISTGTTAVIFSGSAGNIITNQIAIGNTYGVDFETSANNTFKDCVTVDGSTDVHSGFDAGSTNNTLLNCSYGSEIVNGADGQIIRKWYYQAYVNYSNGTLASDANVTAYNITGQLQFTAQTNSSGHIARQELTDYVNLGGTKTFYSNYTILANLSGTGNATGILNLTATQNKMDDFLTLNEPPVDCGTIDTAYGNYTLTQNVSSEGTCFIINANNITIDCNGFWITYSTNGGGNEQGIYSIEDSGITIKNCNIIDGNFGDTNEDRYGVYIQGSAYNFTLFNSTIITNYSSAVSLDSINLFNLTNNSFFSNASIPGAPLHISILSNGTIMQNNLTNYFGVGIDGGFDHTNFVENTIYSNSSAINSVSLSDNSFTNNNFTSLKGGAFNIDGTGGSHNNSITNNILTGYEYGLMFGGGANDFIVINNTCTSNYEANGQAIVLYEAHNSTLVNNTAISYSPTAGEAMWIFNSNNITINNQIALALLSDGNAIHIQTSNNTLIRDCINITGSLNDVLIDSYSAPTINNTFINCSYNTESVDNGQIIRKWYYMSYVNYSNGDLASDANVTAYNSTGQLQFTAQTNTSGHIARQELTDYVNLGGTRTFYSNYTILANLSGTGNATGILNLTATQNKMDDFLTLSGEDTISPTITINYPTGTIADITPLINVSSSESGTIWYNIDDGENITLCESCTSSQNKFLYLEEGTYTIYLFANDSSGNTGTSSNSFTIDMNYHYYDNFDDNSSIFIDNDITWYFGTINFTGGFNYLNDPNLVSAYLFENPSALGQDYKLVNNFTSVTSDPTQNTTVPSGFSGYSIHLDGNDEVCNVASFNASQNHTACWWSYPSSLTVETNQFAQTCFYDTWTSDSAGTYQWRINNCGTVSQDLEIPGALHAGEWTQFCQTYDSSSINRTVYINGAFNSSIGEVAIEYDGSQPWCIGGYDGGGYWLGNIYRPMWFDRILTANEISQIAENSQGSGNSGNFTSYAINTTENITSITNVTWTELNTDAENNITVEVSADGGTTWYTATSGSALGQTFTGENNSIVYRIIFSGSNTIALSDMNISWSTGEADNPPQIIAVYNSTEMTDISSGPNEGPFATYVSLNFTAYDAQGFGDLNDSSVQVNFSLAGEESRLNTSCALLEDYDTNYANYTCNVTIWWWDAPGTWNINASIEDVNGNKAFNDSTTFLIGSTTGFLANSTQLNWPEINPGATNQEANEPLLLNNTGNTQVSVEVNATNLIGENNPSYALGANNFSIHTAPGCGGTTMSRYEYITVKGATISKGNYTLNDGTAQEIIYFCLEISNSDLISQPYSTKQEGNWIIRVFLAAFAIRRRKKNKKIQDDKLLKAINLIADELKEEYSLNKKEVIEIIIERLKKKYDLTRNEFLGIIKAREGITIPITIFTKELGALESLTKYMKENLNMNYRDIAKELGRNERTIWTAYKKANEKQKEPLKIKETKINLPISIFENKELTILESIVIYLKNEGKKYSEIGNLLYRDQRNIWTIYSRAIKKNNT